MSTVILINIITRFLYSPLSSLTAGLNFVILIVAFVKTLASALANEAISTLLPLELNFTEFDRLVTFVYIMLIVLVQTNKHNNLLQCYFLKRRHKETFL